MSNDQQPTESVPLPAPVTGVARGGQGTGTALDDTQLYDVSDFSPVPGAASAGSARAAAQPVPPGSAIAPAPAIAVQPAMRSSAPVEPRRDTPEPVVAASVVTAASSAPNARVASRAPTTSSRRVGVPIAGLAGFALAAGLAVLIGVFLGGVPMPDGAATGGETVAPTEAVPAATVVPAPDNGNVGGAGGNGNGNGNGNNGNGNGNGNNGNGNGNGNGND